jgi:predicted ABC-type ATPase
MKLYTIIAGVNGTGKSSLTGALKGKVSDFGHIIDVDRLAARLGSGFAGGKKAIREISDCINKGLNFSQETTLSGFKTEKTIQLAKEKGYTIRMYYVGLDSADESLRRIENRVVKGGHNVPTEDVLRRFEGRFKSLMKILPYCDEALFYDNENGFVLVAEYRNGELLPVGLYRPGWIDGLIAEINPDLRSAPMGKVGGKSIGIKKRKQYEFDKKKEEAPNLNLIY